MKNAIFQEFTAFLHQDAMLSGGSFSAVVEAALSTMTDGEVMELRRTLVELSSAPNGVIEDAWNKSSSDFYLRGRKAAEFINQLVDVIDRRAKAGKPGQ